MPTLLNKQPLDPTYYSDLTGPERLRYAEKVEMCDRIDPFTLRPGTDTSSDVNVFPGICYEDIANYLVFSANYLTLEEMKAFKSTEAHNYFTSGWVKGLSAKQLQDDKVLLLGEGEENKDTFWEFSDTTAETPTAAPAASEAALPVRRYPVRNRRAPDRYTPS
ncbi:hypothetical protein HPB50_010981 [Hyalomma asiaticum]|uniref:Uncharacterized protein n=1 Tax=Hyalomma asiaticum TaxID=266040 RepID=A0ACB7TIM3_HYAAI|nr:hypothetical protein HPB50_010981 [Hyalomma asiaticum]